VGSRRAPGLDADGRRGRRLPRPPHEPGRRAADDRRRRRRPRAGTSARAASPMKLEEGVALARFTTIGTGGPARFFARTQSVDELEDLLAWSAAAGHAVETIGLGSNVLVHDDGIDAVVVRLTGSLSDVRIDGEELVAGGGATNAVCLHRARD